MTQRFLICIALMGTSWHLAFAESVRGPDLPPGFHSADATPIPPWLRELTMKAAAASARVELVAKRDLPGLKKGDSVQMGSAVIVAPGDRAMTSLHVVDEAMKRTHSFEPVLHLLDGTVVGVAEIQTHGKLDLVTLILKSNLNAFLEKADPNRTPIGESIFAVGYPEGVSNARVTFGSVLGKDEEGSLRLNCTSLPGMSGGPIVGYDRRSKALRLLGITERVEDLRRVGTDIYAGYYSIFLLNVRTMAALRANELPAKSPPDEAPVEEVALSNVKLTLDPVYTTQLAAAYQEKLMPVRIALAAAKATSSPQEIELSTLRAKVSKANEVVFKYWKTLETFVWLPMALPTLSDGEIDEMFDPKRPPEALFTDVADYLETFDSQLFHIAEFAWAEKRKLRLHRSIEKSPDEWLDKSKGVPANLSDRDLNSFFFYHPTFAVPVP